MASKQPLLVFEIDVKRALGHARCAGDLAHAGGVKALGQKDPPGAFDDLAPLAPSSSATIGATRSICAVIAASCHSRPAYQGEQP